MCKHKRGYLIAINVDVMNLLRALSIVPVLLATFFEPHARAQTSIVIKKTLNEIVAGADSKTTKDDKSPGQPQNKILKIRDGVFVAVAGLMNQQDLLESPFSLTEVLTKCGTASRLARESIHDLAETCSREILLKLPATLQAMRNEKPRVYADRVDAKVIIELAFFGIESREFVVYVRNVFVPSLSLAPLGLPRMAGPTDCSGSCVGRISLGRRDAVDVALKQNPRYWDMGLEKAVCSLIALEIKEHPDVVGWPVKILRLTIDSSEQWVERENSCEEQVTPSSPIKNRVDIP